MIAREATPTLVVTAVVAVGLHVAVGWPWAALGWLALALLVLVAREPARDIPAAPLGLVSPVDGRVTAVAHAFDPVLQRSSHRMEIRQRRWGPFALRSPTEGKVVLWHGERADDGSELGTCHVQTDEGDDVVVLVHPGGLPGTFHSRLRQGERAGQGQRFAFMAFGRGVTVYFPVTARPQVSTGDRVRAGADIIALLDRSNGP